MKKTLFLSLILFVTSSLIASSSSDEVTLEQLRQSSHPKEKDAPAAYLINKCSIDYEFASGGSLMFLNYHLRIKVYKEEGEEYATFSLPLYGGGAVREQMLSIDGVTYNEVDGKIEKIALSKADIFTEETTESRQAVKFALPNVRSGSIIDVKYTKSSPYVSSVPRFFFQHFIPVDNAEYVMAVPEYFSMSPVPKGFIELATNKESDTSNNFKQDTYTFTASDLPSIKEDDYVLDIDDYRTSLKYEVSAYQWPGSPRKVLSGDWNYVAKSLMTRGKPGYEIKSHGKLFDDIVAQATGTDDQKIEFLYDYVQRNFTWNGNSNKYNTQTAKKLLQTRVGNSADLNILLLNLLQKVDIKADAAFTRYRFHGMLNSNFPSPTEVNYFLVYAPYKGKPTLMDVSSKSVQLGQLPLRAVNINVLVATKKGGEVIQVSNPNVNKLKIISDYKIDLGKNMVLGAIKGRYADSAAVKYRELENRKNDDEEEDNQDLESDDEEDLEDVIVGKEFKITSVDNMDGLNAAINFEAEEKNYKILNVIGNQLFIDADLDMGINKNPFTDELREYPTFYNYLQDWTKVGKLTIPDGYEVKSVPESVSLNLPGNLGKFRYVTSVKDNVITVQFVFKINRGYFLKNEYPGLKQLYNLIITKQKEKIVLAKS